MTRRNLEVMRGARRDDVCSGDAKTEVDAIGEVEAEAMAEDVDVWDTCVRRGRSAETACSVGLERVGESSLEASCWTEVCGGES
jgi:hypothetical protein